jgi:excisionase family DNA binding protein
MSLSVVSGSDSSTYTAGEAAQLLGVSERRVRQLVDEGRLPADRDDEGRLRLPQRAVHAERARRRKEQARKEMRKEASSPPPTASTPPPAASVDVEALVERIFAAALPRAIEAATATHRTVEAQLTEALAAERAARADAEARAAAAEAKAAQLERATAAPPPPESRQETPRRSWLHRGRR